MLPRLSVALITRNEAGNLPRTLASVQWADEILVIDSGSTDGTQALAQSLGATVLHHPWAGFAAQKNFALEACTGDWILSLDADEELSPALQAEIRSLLVAATTADAYLLKRRNLFLGRWMRHGGFYPDSKLRLFRRLPRHGEPPPRFLERPVHETLSFQGPAVTLEHDLLHHAYPTLHGYLEHMNRYSDLGASLLLSRGRTSRSTLAFLSNTLLLPLGNFAWNFLFRLGFLDGREGFLLHLYQAVYTSWKYSKAWELSRAAQPSASVPATPPNTSRNSAA